MPPNTLASSDGLWARRWACAALAAWPWPLQAGQGLKLALLAAKPEAPAVEALAAGVAVDAFNGMTGRARVGLVAYSTGGSVEGALSAVEGMAGDPAVLGVVVHGEEGAAPEVLAALDRAGLAAVQASSWQAPRAEGAGLVWLSPGQEAMAAAAAEHARKGQRAIQAAVVDNGAATSVASAKAFAERFKALGGTLGYRGTWEGSDWGLTRTVKELRGHWPQAVFFSGGAADAGRLVKAMRRHKELKAAHLMGLPSLMEPAYFKAAGTGAALSWCLFPAPEFRGRAAFARTAGLSFPRASPHYRAYVSYAYRRPGAWSAMVFDATALLLEAAAMVPALEPGPQGRAQVRQALGAIPGYKGIRGRVSFSSGREPAKPRCMAFYALAKVNSRVMRWYGKEFGPPFH